MYQKVKSFFKKMAASKNLKALAIMLLCGVGSVYAQTTAGDYSAGTGALTTVAEENAFWINHTQIKYDKMNIKLKKTRYK